MTVLPRFALLPVALVLLACESSVSQGPSGSAAPSLRTPGDHEQIKQNDPATGCSFSPTHGYGFQVAFSWTPVAEADHYHLRLVHTGAQYPVIDTDVNKTSYLVRDCNAYVIEANRFDWQWTVAAVFEDGEEAWAQQRTYEFGPMVLPPQP